MTLVQKKYRKLKNIYYWIAFGCSYVFPFVFFLIWFGVTRVAHHIVLPVVLVAIFAILKLMRDIPKWVSTWEPSIKKGIVKAIPIFLLFFFLITLGIVLEHLVKEGITKYFNLYYRVVFVFFGGMSVGAVFEAFHLKYKELYLISRGYVLGVVNKE